MRTLFAIVTIVAVALVPAIAMGGQQYRLLSASDTGLDGDALSGGATSDSIDLGERFYATALDWQMTVTAGSSTAMTVTCEESVDGSTWVKIMHCTDAPSSTCEEQVLNYDLTTTPSVSVLIDKIRAQYLRCTATATGNGTISATATVTSI